MGTPLCDLVRSQFSLIAVDGSPIDAVMKITSKYLSKGAISPTEETSYYGIRWIIYDRVLNEQTARGAYDSKPWKKIERKREKTRDRLKELGILPTSP